VNDKINNRENDEVKSMPRLVSGKDIVQAYQIDISSPLAQNAFEKLKISLAVQVFSNTVSAMISTLVKTSQLRSETGSERRDAC
jgi:hypothetical protein